MSTKAPSKPSTPNKSLPSKPSTPSKSLPSKPSTPSTSNTSKKKDKGGIGVARKIRGSGYPTDEQLDRFRRRIRVELVKDRKDEFGRNYWSKMDETKRIFGVSGNHNLHVRAFLRIRPLLLHEEEEEGGEGPIPHFEEDGLKVFYPNVTASTEGKYTIFNAFSVFGDYVDQPTLFDNFMPPSLRYYLSGGNAAFVSYGASDSGLNHTLFGPDFWDYLEAIYVPPGSKNNSKFLDNMNRDEMMLDDGSSNLDVLFENNQLNLDNVNINNISRPQSRGNNISSRPQSRGNNISSRPQSRGTMSTRPQSRASEVSSVPSSLFTTYPGDKRAVQNKKLNEEIPDCSEFDGIFPRAISYIFKEVSHRGLYEQTNIVTSLSIMVVNDYDTSIPVAYDMLSLNPTEPKALRWSPEEESYWPDDLVVTETKNYKSFLNECYRGYLARDTLEMEGLTTIYLIQCKITGVSDRWDVRGDRLSEGEEKTGKYYFVECCHTDQTASSGGHSNQSALLECLAKARLNAFPTGKAKRSLPIRNSPLTQVLSSALKPGQMMTFVANMSIAQKHYDESYQTCHDVDYIHMANRNTNLLEGKSSVMSTKSTKMKKKKRKKKVKKKMVRKKKDIDEGKKVEEIDEDPSYINPNDYGRKHVKITNNVEYEKLNWEPTSEVSKHDVMPPVLAKPSRLSEMLASSSVLSPSKRRSSIRKKNISSPSSNQMFISSNIMNTKHIVYPEDYNYEKTNTSKNTTGEDVKDGDKKDDATNKYVVAM